MRTLRIAAFFAGVFFLSGTAAVAEPSSVFRGLRVQADVGGNRFDSEGQHDNKLGFGISTGFDGVVADKILIGPEFSYWRARGENFTITRAGAREAHKSFGEVGVGLRAGYLVDPKLLIFGTGGYVGDEQRVATSPLPRRLGVYRHFSSNGYQFGGGVEYSLTHMFYVAAAYRYSRYNDNTARQRLFASVGVRWP